jgi:hypothetical protein
MPLENNDIFPAYRREMIGNTASAYASPDDDNLRLLWDFSHVC